MYPSGQICIALTLFQFLRRAANGVDELINLNFVIAPRNKLLEIIKNPR